MDETNIKIYYFTYLQKYLTNRKATETPKPDNQTNAPNKSTTTHRHNQHDEKIPYK